MDIARYEIYKSVRTSVPKPDFLSFRKRNTVSNPLSGLKVHLYIAGKICIQQYGHYK